MGVLPRRCGILTFYKRGHVYYIYIYRDALVAAPGKVRLGSSSALPPDVELVIHDHIRMAVGLPSAIRDFPPEANGGPAHAGCPATVSRPRQCKRLDRCRTLVGTFCSLHKCINAEPSSDCVGRASQPQDQGCSKV